MSMLLRRYHDKAKEESEKKALPDLSYDELK